MSYIITQIFAKTKTLTSFRLSQSTLTSIQDLATELAQSKTKIVEEAIALFSAKNHNQKAPNSLMKYFGEGADEDVEAMLKDIKNSRINKDINIDF